MAGVDGCVFCGIVAGETPASLVFRDGRCTAFMDTRPSNAGQVLVVPNDHAASLADLPEGDGAAMFAVARRVATALYRSGLRCDGVNLSLSDGEVAGQEVPHVHLHVVPRFEGDGVCPVLGPHPQDEPPREELAEAAGLIRDAL